jgi:hypothetical protein
LTNPDSFSPQFDVTPSCRYRRLQVEETEPIAPPEISDMPQIQAVMPQAGTQFFSYREWFVELRSLRLVTLGWTLMRQRWPHSEAF